MSKYKRYKKQNNNIIAIILIVAIFIGGAFLVYKYFPAIKSWFVPNTVEETIDENLVDITEEENVNLGGPGTLDSGFYIVGETEWQGVLPNNYEFVVSEVAYEE